MASYQLHSRVNSMRRISEGDRSTQTKPEPAAVKTRIVLNGRFLIRPPSGVERVAHQIAAELSSIARQLSDVLAFEIALPSAASDLNPPFEVSAIHVGKRNGHAFEQFELSRLSRNGWLYNPCNSGPMFHRRQLVTIHDAQIYSVPQAYSKAFVAWYRLMLPMLGRNARLVTTVSDFSRAELEEYGVSPPHRIAVVPNGADHIDAIAPDPQALHKFGLGGQPYILAIGSLSPHKNLGMLTAAAITRPPEAPMLVVAGGGNAAVFAQAGLTESSGVRMLGRVTDGDLKALYANALALAFPSLTEGFGLPPLEAMRCGCPIIASTGGAIPETCGDAALYVDPHDAAGWADAMIRMQADDAMRCALIEKGRTRASSFTWRRAALEICALIATADQNLTLIERLTAFGETATTANHGHVS